MQINSDILPKGRKYELLEEMQIRAKELGKEAFTAYNLRDALKGFMRNPRNLRDDLEELALEGRVHKSEKLVRIPTYKPDPPSSSILAGRILENFKATGSDLKNLIRLARANIHFECQRCGKFFAGAHVFVVPIFPLRLCPFCLSNSKLSWGIKTRPRVIQ